MIRQPIVSVLGHVDHGKTSLLDKIRGSAVVEREAGGITQHIGATEIPLEVLEGICGGLLKQLKIDVTLPGLLFIDTPGHAAFTTLRKRGGALADFAILVIDINEGFKPQTIEALNILKAYKTPFLIAANKIDRIAGWQVFQNYPVVHSLNNQNEDVRHAVETKIYELVGKLYEEGFETERFDRVKKFKKEVAIIPISARTGEGIPELLMMLIGLAQKFMGDKLDIEMKTPAKGTVLEVKEETGLGVTLDVIIYDGMIKRGDGIVVGTKTGPIATKVRSLLKPKPLDEIRDPRYRFNTVKEAHASCGVKIAAPNLKDALAGTPMRVVGTDLEKTIEEVNREIEEVKIETDKEGIIIKADTLGSLEALISMFRAEGISIRKANVGDISRRDIIEAESVKENAKEMAAILGFNVKMLKDATKRAKDTKIPILLNNVIYRLIEDYQTWLKEEREKEKQKEFDDTTRPAKILLLPDHVFRASKPAIVGIEVLRGNIKNHVRLMDKDGVFIGKIKGIQEENKSISQAEQGKQVAISIAGPTVGKHINEGDILYTELTEDEARLINSKYKTALTPDEDETFDEIIKIKRKDRPFWAKGGN